MIYEILCYIAGFNTVVWGILLAVYAINDFGCWTEDAMARRRRTLAIYLILMLLSQAVWAVSCVNLMHITNSL